MKDETLKWGQYDTNTRTGTDYKPSTKSGPVLVSTMFLMIYIKKHHLRELQRGLVLLKIYLSS